MDYQKLKFNGIVYPYVEISLYNYNLNKERKVKVSTTQLDKDIQKNLETDDKDLVKRIREIDSEIKYFVPQNILVKGDEKNISKFIEDNFLYN